MKPFDTDTFYEVWMRDFFSSGLRCLTKGNHEQDEVEEMKENEEIAQFH